MKKQLSYYVKKLEDVGIDTSKFNLELNGVILKIEELEKSKSVIKDVWIPSSADDFYKEKYLYTLRAINSKVQNKYGGIESGYNAFVRTQTSYNYMIKDVLEVLKYMNKVKDFDELAVLKTIYDTESITQVMESILKKSKRQMEKKVIDECLYCIEEYRQTEESAYVKEFSKRIPNLDFNTPKCGVWSDMYKAINSYCTLVYLIKMKGVTINNLNTQSSLEYINGLCESLKQNNGLWRYFELLNSVIENSGFKFTE